eukprot:7387812-Prymnesium_polylepis.2
MRSRSSPVATLAETERYCGSTAPPTHAHTQWESSAKCLKTQRTHCNSSNTYPFPPFPQTFTTELREESLIATAIQFLGGGASHSPLFTTRTPGNEKRGAPDLLSRGLLTKTKKLASHS